MQNQFGLIIQQKIDKNIINKSYLIIMGNSQSKIQEVKPAAQVTNTNQNTAPQVLETGSTPVANEKAQVADIPFNFKHTIENIGESLLGVGPWIHRKKLQINDHQFMNCYRDVNTKFQVQVKEPLCKLYNQVPEKFTEAKFELIDPYTYNQRFALLNILCALTAIGSISRRSSNPFSTILRTTRNVSFIYIFAGLVLAPQIYNPFIKS